MDKLQTDCNSNAAEMNDKPNTRQKPLVGFARECVLSAEDHALYAAKYLDEVIYHRLSTEEIIRNIAIANAEVNKIIGILRDAKLAGMKSNTNLED